MNANDMASKNTFVFDLDGTLTVTKSPITEPVSGLLRKLLLRRKVAVMGGGTYAQFREQLVGHLGAKPDELANLYLFPTCGTQFYMYDPKGRGFKQVYSHELSDKEKGFIISALEAAVKESGVPLPEVTYGSRIEDRGSQITFSAMGQQAPAEKKARWDPGHAKRKGIAERLDKLLGGKFEARIGGTTSIDVTRAGQDKAYGIAMICENIGTTVSDIVFIGDALFEGGNDYSVTKTGVETVQVSSPDDTAELIRAVLAEMDAASAPT